MFLIEYNYTFLKIQSDSHNVLNLMKLLNPLNVVLPFKKLFCLSLLFYASPPAFLAFFGLFKYF